MSDMYVLAFNESREVSHVVGSWWESAKGAYAPETVRALEGDLRHWASWCELSGLSPWPVTVPALVAWLDGYQGARASMRRRLASLRVVARASGEDPTTKEEVRLAMKAASRRLAGGQRQAKPWTWQESTREAKAGLRDRESPMVRIRDQAIIRLASDTLARSSEMRAFCVGDLVRNPDGSGSIVIRRSKTDQEGQGSWRYISVEALISLDRWLMAAKIQDGPLFRGLPQGEYPGKAAMSAMALWRVYQRMGERVGGGYSPHSTRVGAAVDMVSAGLELPAIMQAGGWQSAEMVARYSAKVATTRGASARLAKLQNRS